MRKKGTKNDHGFSSSFCHIAIGVWSCVVLSLDPFVWADAADGSIVPDRSKGLQ